MRRFILLLTVLSGLAMADTYGCTIVMASGDNQSLAGSNEDSVFPLTLIWFVPATEGNYARVCLGYKMMINSLQGGMNEKGLFIDGNTVGSQGWRAGENKKPLPGSLLDYILAKCATVEEVKQLFNSYNTPALDQARIPVMDKSGASMIVEWYDGKVVFIESEKPYLVATNFIESKYRDAEKPCWRYNKAEELLNGKEVFTGNLIREVLDATHQEGDGSKTVYSFICDLREGNIEIYNYHQFSVPVKFNLSEEINKGYKEYYLGNLFTAKNDDYMKFVADGPVNMIEFGYRRINRSAALMFYGILKTHYPVAFDVKIDINVLSKVGKNLMEQGFEEDAVIFLERNAAEFPDSARSHFELGEGWLNAGKKDKAIGEFKKTLEIDPSHTEARKALEKLGAIEN